MDYLNFFESGIFSDLSLIIKDDNDNLVEMNVHKIIICSKSAILYRMLTGNFREATESTITITTPNAHVTHDIIISMYGKTMNSTDYEQWYYELMWIMCCDYLEIQQDFQSLVDIKVPEEGFELLVHVIDTIKNPLDKKSKIILENLPKNYDITKLPQCLIGRICDLTLKDISVFVKGSKIIICDDKLLFIDKIKTPVKPKLIAKLYDHQVVIADNTGEVYVYNLYTKNIVIKSGYSCGADVLTVSPDNQFVVIGKNDCVYIFNSATMKLKSTIRTAKITAIACSSNHIATGHNDGSINVWDIYTKQLIDTLNCNNDYINTIVFSSDYTKLLCCDNMGHIIIKNMITNEIFKHKISIEKQFFYLNFTPGSGNNSICYYNGRCYYNGQCYYGREWRIGNSKTDRVVSRNLSEKILGIYSHIYLLKKSKDKSKKINFKDYIVWTTYHDNENIRNYVTNIQK
ncbi:putative BTB/POZ domain and WD-repeat protein [Cotonvirus japonicus]|uniref:BTB/POZ domain and WD-repeat protein n=1 Tax=Cotonvirus japonicus TaxID=2811091 RepID=A0ABM7NSI9_9VIRU|nr:putative BTB/POZ domain and WD-repeat protein [Cotonvirus japonicus]BCS83130.1 putative BTB/POZ domain and WD-repeat protein [Cotonvirus japonicus]